MPLHQPVCIHIFFVNKNLKIKICLSFMKPGKLISSFFLFLILYYNRTYWCFAIFLIAFHYNEILKIWLQFRILRPLFRVRQYFRENLRILMAIYMLFNHSVFCKRSLKTPIFMTQRKTPKSKTLLLNFVRFLGEISNWNRVILSDMDDTFIQSWFFKCENILLYSKMINFDSIFAGILLWIKSLYNQ